MTDTTGIDNRKLFLTLEEYYIDLHPIEDWLGIEKRNARELFFAYQSAWTTAYAANGVLTVHTVEGNLLAIPARDITTIQLAARPVAVSGSNVEVTSHNEEDKQSDDSEQAVTQLDEFRGLNFGPGQ